MAPEDRAQVVSSANAAQLGKLLLGGTEVVVARGAAGTAFHRRALLRDDAGGDSRHSRDSSTAATARVSDALRSAIAPNTTLLHLLQG